MDNKEKSPEQELIESIGLMIEKGVESNTNIYTGVVKGVDGKRAVVTVNGRDQNVAIATADVSSGNVVKVFVPSNNMSAAFIIKAESSGGGGGTTTNYGDLTNKPSINGNTLIGNKTSAQIGVYGSDNPPPYPVTSVNGQTGDVTIEAGGNVDSVNGKTGTVVLDKSDIGLGNVDNVKQYSASNPPPYPVMSVDGETGAVVTNAVKTTAQSLTDAQKTQARTNIGAGTSNFSGSYNDLTDKPTIPDPYTLPVASSDTLGGVKPVTKTDAMTKYVGVDTDGALYTAQDVFKVVVYANYSSQTGVISYTVDHTFAEIKSAVNLHIPVMLYYRTNFISTVREYMLAGYNSINVWFISFQGGNAGDASILMDRINISSSDAITLSSKNIELTSNKVTALSDDSTNTEYPSAKTTWDTINGMKTLPDVTEEDDGAFLRVVNGGWEIAMVPDANGGSF